MRRWILALALCAPVLGQVKLPPYTREALPNGAVAYYVQKAGLPLVNFRVLVKGGMESDPADMAGLAAVTAELLRRGTAGRTAAQVSDEMDGLGGTFNAMVDEQSTAIAAEFLAKDFDRGLALVADAVLTPAFPEEEVRKALARRIDGIRTIKDNPGRAIDSYYRSFFFGNRHPYGRVADEVSLAKIQRDAVVNYHKRMYVGRNLIVIVAGNFDLAAAKTVVTRSFGAVAAGTGYNWVEDRPPAAAGPRVLLVDKPDATQTYFVIARPGVRRSTPDRAALTLVNTLVGGRFTSMLNEELRVNSGLTYGARSQAEMDRLTGAIYISTYTRTESTARAIGLALDVLNRLQEKGLTAEQLASAKAYVKGTYAPNRLQTADQIAGELGEIELFGLGADEVNQFFQRIDAVTLEEANGVAQRDYRPEGLTFILVGNAARIRDVAAKYGPKVVERPATQPGWTGM